MKQPNRNNNHKELKTLKDVLSSYVKGYNIWYVNKETAETEYLPTLESDTVYMPEIHMKENRYYRLMSDVEEARFQAKNR